MRLRAVADVEADALDDAVAAKRSTLPSKVGACRTPTAGVIGGGSW